MSDVWTTRRLQGMHGAVPEAPKRFEGTSGEHEAVWTVLRMAEPHTGAIAVSKDRFTRDAKERLVSDKKV